MRRLFLCSLLFLTVSPVIAQAAEVQSEKQEAIIELMTVTGAMDMGDQMAQAMTQQMIQVLRQARPDIPARAFDIAGEEVQSVVMGELAKGDFQDTIVPLYDKYFTLSEIQQLLDFYATDIGKKTIEVMPQLTQESMIIGQQWGESIGPIIGQRITRRLAEEGIEIQAQPPGAQ